MKFTYEALDSAGKRTRSVVEASSSAEAGDLLRGKGLYPTKIEEAAADARPGHETAATEHGKLWQPRLDSVASFTRELSVLVATGVPIADALEAVERQERDEDWADVIADVRAAVERGRSLSDALMMHPEYFGPVYRSLVSAGEESGELDTMLTRLASVVRQQVVVRKAVTGALIYPAALILLSVSAAVVMLMVVVPRFGDMFASLDAELPATTQFLLVASSALMHYWWIALLAVAVSAAALVFWMRTNQGRLWADRFILTAPYVSKVTRGLGEARIARLFSTLLASHMPLLDAVDLIAGSMTNSAYRTLMLDARRCVSEGDGLTTAFEHARFVSPRFIEAVRTGESTGRLPAVLASLSDHADHDNDVAVKSLTKTIEPVIVTGMGVAIAFLALSLFLPLFDLTSAAGAAS
ncbi:MAG: type II secretion system F family protein [Planctomycetota bacterium]